MAEISVIVPVYNVENYIRRCLDSILNQTFTNFELILVDDGSIDNSGKVCDQYSDRDKRIRVIHQENHGQAFARNRGINIAKCDWIAFVDADDVVHPQYLEILYRAVCESNAKISVCHAYEGEVIPDNFFAAQKYCAKLFSIDEQRLSSWFCEEDNNVSKYTYWIVWGKLIHKSILQQYLFSENRIYEDNAVVFKWLYTAEMIVFCDNVLYFYFVNHDSTTKKKYSLKRLDWLWAVEEQISFYEKIGYHKLETMIRKRYIWEALREYSNICNLLGDKCAARKLRRHILFYCKKNSKRISMLHSEKMEVLSRLYPKSIMLLSKFSRAIKR